MLHRMYVVDCATRCIFAPAANIGVPLKRRWSSSRSQTNIMFTTAIGALPSPGVRGGMCALLLKPQRVLPKGCHVTPQVRHTCDTVV